MERNEIKQLLEKYYEGLTSLQEEKELKDYFNGGDILPELETDRELFAYTQAESETLPLNNGLEKKLSDWIDLQDQKPGKGKSTRMWGYLISGVAASIALFTISYYTLFAPDSPSRTGDTYKDPQAAYLEAKRALMYVSMQLNKGTEPLSNMNKINEGMDGLSTFSTVGKSFDQLELISKYSNKFENNTQK
jgi:hypothetical protein